MSLPTIIGCEEFPKSEHGKLLIEDICNFINKNYQYSGKTVVEAFEKAAMHDLYLDGKRVDPSTFGKYLSRSSVGKILTAYKESVRDGKARPQGYNYKQLPEAPVKKITPQEAHDLILKWCKEDGKLPLAAPYNIAFRYLVDNGLVEDVKEIKGGRTKQLFGAMVEVSAKRQAAENWYIRNVINKNK